MAAIKSVETLRKIPYFVDLGPAELDRIQRRVLVSSYDKGEILFLEKEPCEGLYFVESGRVKVFKTSPDGKEQVLRVMQAGESFNEVPVFDGGPNPASAEALDKAVVYTISKGEMLALIRDVPDVANRVLKVFASRLRHLTMLVEDLSFRHVTGRLAKVLLEHADSAHDAPRRRLTQQEMASLIGTAREVVGRSLKTLEEQGIIRMEGHRIVIVDRKALARLV
ncbi:MAG: Crp/Fnr family transcriptional regulator [Chloroflexi bacterium]|nr:Crp/Fnr family transcriptional regulator [Chloroflexota bacterium]